MVWTIIEPGLAIVASSLATIRPLLRAMRVRGFESTEDSSNKRSRDQQSSPRRMTPRSPYGLDDITLTTTTRRGDKDEVYVVQTPVDEGRRSTWGDEDERSLVRSCDLEAQGQVNEFGYGGRMRAE